MNFVSIQKFIQNQIYKSPITKQFTTVTESKQTSIQVCLLGGHTPIGRMTSLLLKQNPVISKLKIHGDKLVNNLAVDLNQIDTKCVVEAFSHVRDIRKALRGTDIVLLLPNISWPKDTPLVPRTLAECKRIYNFTKECTVQAPRAIIVVAVPPVSIFTPFVANCFKKSNFYHPGRIVGSAAIAQAKINSLVGRYQDLDPYVCNVPIIGGPDIDLAVPLLSKAKPVEIDNRSAMTLMAQFRNIHKDDFPKKHSRRDVIEDHEFSEAYALNNMIMTLGCGICGDGNAFCNAFVRSNLISSCQHLVTTLQFSKGGVIHNLGLPTLTKFELDMLERAALEIKEREQMAKELVEFCEGKYKMPPFEVKDREKKKTLIQSVIK